MLKKIRRGVENVLLQIAYLYCCLVMFITVCFGFGLLFAFAFPMYGIPAYALAVLLRFSVLPEFYRRNPEFRGMV
jgi:hypothetical protein